MLENSAHMILHVHVIGANDIEQCDETGWSDPYIVVTSNEMEVASARSALASRCNATHNANRLNGPVALTNQDNYEAELQTT